MNKKYLILAVSGYIILAVVYLVPPVFAQLVDSGVIEVEIKDQVFREKVDSVIASTTLTKEQAIISIQNEMNNKEVVQSLQRIEILLQRINKSLNKWVVINLLIQHLMWVVR